MLCPALVMTPLWTQSWLGQSDSSTQSPLGAERAPLSPAGTTVRV